ncbi:MAG: hypothetical protein DRI95_12300 [Bacteroidetes bacterium]|nr:MAG: hypothetical protein DRI95_12300 [Bacteroidota bacterium]
MIEQLFSRANSIEVNGAATRVIDATKQIKINDELLNALVSNLEKVNQELTKSNDLKQSKDGIPDVWDLETLRDRGLKAFFNIVKGGTFRLNDKFAEQSEKIYEVIERHGLNMHKLPNKKQTATMNSLFNELNKPELIEALKDTGTQVLLNEVKIANQDFLAAFDERNKDTSGRANLILLIAARTDVRKQLEQIIDYVNTVSKVLSKTVVKKLQTKLGDIISKSNKDIKSRIDLGDDTDK